MKSLAKVGDTRIRRRTGLRLSPVPCIRVVVVDDHASVRQGLIRLLQTASDIQVLGEAADGLAALELVRKCHPDVVIMDVEMPGLNGVEATRQIKAEASQTRVIGLSMYEGDHWAKAMQQAGASVYLAKTASAENLLDAVRAR